MSKKKKSSLISIPVVLKLETADTIKTLAKQNKMSFDEYCVFILKRFLRSDLLPGDGVPVCLLYTGKEERALRRSNKLLPLEAKA